MLDEVPDAEIAELVAIEAPAGIPVCISMIALITFCSSTRMAS